MEVLYFKYVWYVLLCRKNMLKTRLMEVGDVNPSTTFGTDDILVALRMYFNNFADSWISCGTHEVKMFNLNTLVYGFS